MNALIDRIRAYVAAIPTHRCDGCDLDFTSETMTCPSCGIADRTQWIADSEASRLLREVAALEPVGYACIAWGNLQKIVRRNDVAGEFVAQHDIYETAAPEVLPVYTLTGEPK